MIKKKYFLIILLTLSFLVKVKLSYSQETIPEENIVEGTGGEGVTTEEAQVSVEIPNEPEELGGSEIPETTEVESEILPTQENTEILPPDNLPVETENNESILDFLKSKNKIDDNLTKRNLTKKINLDTDANHSCELSVFSVDVGRSSNQRIVLNLTKSEDAVEEKIEIGSLPKGIDIREISGDYSKIIGPDQTSIILNITKQNGAQSGSFNIPIVYTSKSMEKSSVIVCQLNIKNLR